MPQPVFLQQPGELTAARCQQVLWLVAVRGRESMEPRCQLAIRQWEHYKVRKRLVSCCPEQTGEARFNWALKAMHRQVGKGVSCGQGRRSWSFISFLSSSVQHSLILPKKAYFPFFHPYSFYLAFLLFFLLSIHPPFLPSIHPFTHAPNYLLCDISQTFALPSSPPLSFFLLFLPLFLPSLPPDSSLLLLNMCSPSTSWVLDPRPSLGGTMASVLEELTII